MKFHSQNVKENANHSTINRRKMLTNFQMEIHLKEIYHYKNEEQIAIFLHQKCYNYEC